MKNISIGLLTITVLITILLGFYFYTYYNRVQIGLREADTSYANTDIKQRGELTIKASQVVTQEGKSTSMTNIWLGTDKEPEAWLGIRFEGLMITPQATITEATLTLHTNETNTDKQVKSIIFADKSDKAEPFDETNVLSSRYLSQNFVLFTPRKLLTSQSETVNITPLIRETYTNQNKAINLLLKTIETYNTKISITTQNTMLSPQLQILYSY